jgi:hypothetical protein
MKMKAGSMTHSICVRKREMGRKGKGRERERERRRREKMEK